MKCILDSLEENAIKFRDKPLFCDSNKSLSFFEVLNQSKLIGTAITKTKVIGKPVPIFMNKNVGALVSMLGVMYSGNFYTVVDVDSPNERVSKLLDILTPEIVIIEKSLENKFKELCKNYKVLIYEDSVTTDVDEKKLNQIRENMVDTDPAYILFTSGSTGTPKGTVLNHNNIVTYISWFVKTFNINSDNVFGNQTPFYFSMSVTDIYASIFAGATFHIIPKSCFSFPVSLTEYLDERKINTIYWVPSVFTIVASIDLFNYAKPKYLKTIMFAGEVMPNKQLNYWRKHLPDALYANLFGPTKATDICCYYIVNREFKDDESLPIGIPCNNCGAFLYDEQNKCKVTKQNVLGELLIRGNFLAMGYYKNPEKTSQAFVQNPLNSLYPEIVYKTGDLVKINKYGEFEYICRKDFQIKHMGYRIELGEIETAAGSIDGVSSCVCLYDFTLSKIVLIYNGTQTKETVIKDLAIKVPSYMLPNILVHADVLPYNQNGKIDRAYLKENYSKIKEI